MTHPGERFYPEGVHWDDPIARGTLPDLLSKAAAQYGARPAIGFRDRPISYAELEAMVEVAASAVIVAASPQHVIENGCRSVCSSGDPAHAAANAVIPTT